MQAPEGYKQDAQGALVPVEKIKPQHLLEDEIVRKLCTSATALHDTLSAFKAAAMNEASDFRALVAQEYGVEKGGAKGNMTLRSFDGQLEMQIAVSDSLSFGPELGAAKALIDNCLLAWSEGANTNLVSLIDHAFQVNKQGRIDTGRVLGLRRLDITDPKWKNAMDAISDAVRVTSSTEYVRFYQRDPETGEKTPISLDLAKL